MKIQPSGQTAPLNLTAPIVSSAMIAAENGWASFSNSGDVLPKGAASKTFECWGKQNGDPGHVDLYYFTHGAISSSNDSIGLLFNGDSGSAPYAPNLGVFTGAAVSPVTNYLEWNDGQWHHFVLTYNGSTTAQLYVDGVAAVALTISAQNVGSSQALTIGNSKASGTHGTAFVDEMAVYSGVLSSARILAHYNERYTGRYAAAVLRDTPIVYYRFNDAGPGTTMADSSGNAHNGTYNAIFTPNSSAVSFVFGVPQGAVV